MYSRGSLTNVVVEFAISNKFFQYISTGVILPLSNNDTNTDVEIKENRENYFVLSSPDEANKYYHQMG